MAAVAESKTIEYLPAQDVLERLISFYEETNNGSLQPPHDSPITVRVVYHLDINQCILFEDSSTGKDPVGGINTLLSKMISFDWDGSGEEMPFFDFVHQKMDLGDYHEKAHKKDRVAVFSHFVDLLEKNLDSLGEKKDVLEAQLEFLMDNEYPFAESARKVVEFAKEKITESSIPHAFYTLLDYLSTNCRNGYTIQLQSFGKDFPKVQAEFEKENERRIQLNQDSAGEVKLIPPFDITVTYSYDEATKTGVWTRDDTGEILDSTEKVYAFYNGYSSFTQCDWPHWNSNGEAPSAGKQYPYNSEDINTVTVFADDNAIRDCKGKLGCVAPIDLSGTPIPLSDAIVSGRVLPVDLEVLFNRF